MQAPDEESHLRYVDYLLERRTLPNQLDPSQRSVGEGHQHPLYYIGAAIVAAPISQGPVIGQRMVFRSTGVTDSVFKNTSSGVAFYLLRLLGALMAALLVAQVFRIATLLGIDWKWPVAIAATLPQWLFIASSVSNDGLTGVLSAYAIASAIEASLVNDSRSWLRAGLWAGVAFMAKKSAIILFPAGFLLLLLVGRSVRSAGWFLGSALLVAAPLVIRNIVLYGEPLGTLMEIETLPNLLTPRDLTSSYFLTEFPMGLASSFVGLFGWTAVQVPMRIVALYWLALAPGMLLSFRRVARPQVMYLWSVVLLNLAGLIQYKLTFSQAQGRLLFPSLAAFACIWGVGMAGKKSSRLWVTFVVLMVCLDVYSVVLNYNFYR